MGSDLDVARSQRVFEFDQHAQLVEPTVQAGIGQLVEKRASTHIS
jgi:hypothetical protein